MNRLMARRSYGIRLVTPAFVAGADQQDPRLRVSSIRGCLRWWYRLSLKAAGRSIAAIQREEADLFGSEALGQRVVLRLADMRLGPRRALEYRSFSFDHQYLWFALRPSRGSSLPVARPAVPAGTTFRLEVLIPPHLEDAESRLARFDQAVSSWVLFGGIGLRCRRGAGSLWFESALPSGTPVPTGADSLRRVLEAAHAALASISTFTLDSDVHGTWEEALAAVGGRYRGRRLEIRQRQGRHALPALGWPILGFPGDGTLVVRNGSERRVERLASPVWVKVVPDGQSFRWLLFVVTDPFWKRVRSSEGEVVARAVLPSFAEDFGQAQPPGRPGPRRRRG